MRAPDRRPDEEAESNRSQRSLHGLHAFNNHDHADAAARFVDYNFAMIPKYWEKPELLAGYVKMWERDA